MILTTERLLLTLHLHYASKLRRCEYQHPSIFFLLLPPDPESQKPSLVEVKDL